MSTYSVSIKGINIEGCKIPIGSEPINKRNTRLYNNNVGLLFTSVKTMREN